MSDEKRNEMVKIVLAKNGPILVNGPVQLEDAEGEKIDAGDTFALCRCGKSKNKPFCDGTHLDIGFEG